jgi:formylglycine-generating enzyme required for sulfatase activity
MNMSHISASTVLSGLAALLLAGAGPAPAAPAFDAEPLRRALRDLEATHGAAYDGEGYLARLEEIEKRAGDPSTAAAAAADFEALRREALLANPLLDFDRLLLVMRGVDDAGLPLDDERKKRRREGRIMGLPQNWQGNCSLPRRGYENEIAVLSPVRPDGKLTTLFRPPGEEFVGDIDLRADADRLLFSMPQPEKPAAWRIWELGADGTGLRQVSPDEEDIDHYDACYLPDGRIIFNSTAGFQGVPCVGGGDSVANLYIMDADGTNIRQLCYDQEHNWCPTVMNDGRVMYTRWEYTDSPHYFTRLLFAMNPDGTAQMAIYGSNSYWPNSLFFARPIPGHPSRIIGVISGHHGAARMGELVLFDVGQGRKEADGAVQRIPGYAKPVEPIIRDGLVESSWPKFVHPFPLSDKYFLVSCKPSPNALMGIYLVDVFDNLVCLLEEPGYALLEPIPLRPTQRPPAIADRFRPGEKDALVYLSDVYAGQAMAGVPRGAVKKLRVYEYHFAYRRMGGHINIGVDGPWDVHRILGTVPVREDGSAFFKVPANTPVAVQPLDGAGRAVQIMRSWFSAQPGERISCVGCHESVSGTPPSRGTIAARLPPDEIAPWRGPPRGFSFVREVQPVLDRLCVGCHDGSTRPDGKSLPNFASDQPPGTAGKRDGSFHSSYLALHPYVRRPGPESDYHTPAPYEYFAETSELIQLLRKGHYGVRLDDEAWDRLITWIDLNVPDHGTWAEHRDIPDTYREKRAATRLKYANRTEDPESYPTPPPEPVAFIKPEAPPADAGADAKAEGWPFDEAEAKRRQASAGLPPELRLTATNGLMLEFVLVPAGEYVMGDPAGFADERPAARVRIEQPFYLSKREISNGQYAAFDPRHDSAYLSWFNKDVSDRGTPLNTEPQPVVRVAWKDAASFCEWLSRETGRRCSLPTEAQWEWACRAGTASPMNYGAEDTAFGGLANLADVRLVELCRRDSLKWLPCVATVNDGHIGTARVDAYAPNAWGLYNMHGNAAEWMRSSYRPYPYNPSDGRDAPDADGLKVARGGSFYDRPHWARSAVRQAYLPWQRVFDVGFRVVVEADPPAVAATAH